jgi:hypothetical protein
MLYIKVRLIKVLIIYFKGVSMKCEKYIKNGKVAVLISPSYGAGWFTWNKKHVELLFDKEIIQQILFNDNRKALIVAQTYNKYFTINTINDLKVVWLDKGTQFFVDEYDGKEAIRYNDERCFFA